MALARWVVFWATCGVTPSSRTFAPIVAALSQEGLHEDPPRVAQHGDEEMDDDGALADAHSLLPEVHLHLVPRRRLVPHGRQLQRTRRRAAPDLPAGWGCRSSPWWRPEIGRAHV